MIGSSHDRSYFRSTIILLIFVLFFFLFKSVPQAFAADIDSSAVEQRIQRIQNGLAPFIVTNESYPKKSITGRMAELGIPGVSIAVIHKGKIDWARGFGVMERGGLPVTPDTLFQAASISKPVTAMAVLRMAESKKIDLDTDVNKYLKSWKVPSNSFTGQADVTIRRLLSHTAGMTIHGFKGYEPGAAIPSLVQVLKGEKPANTQPVTVDTVPGTIWRYSGGGYEVLQLAMQDITGKSFPEFMQEMVLAPFGMTHSTFEQPLPEYRQGEAAAAYRNHGQPVRGRALTHAELAAAGLWTTPSDLAGFIINIQETLSGKSQKLISRETAQMMTTPVLGNYGLGLQTGGSESKPYFGHGGSNVGFKCKMIAYKNGDGAVVMTNCDTGIVLIREIIRAVAVEYGWPDFQPRLIKEMTVSPDILKQYAGTYKLAPNFDLNIICSNNQLMLNLPGQGYIPIFAESGTKFYSALMETEIEFIKDDKGSVTHLIYMQEDNNIKAVRK